MRDIERVHHLDCATMCPVVVSRGGNHLVAHVLVIETARSGLVLVDTGIGDAARRSPGEWLGSRFTRVVRPSTDPGGSARSQLAAMGLDPHDVRHVVVTHLDLDHAGGLADFPDATVHVHAHELAAATDPSWRERDRYRPIQWSHGPSWATYRRMGEEWFGFPAVHALEGLPEEVLLVPLPGHTRGHCAVAVDAPGGWLLHAGDAYFQAHTVDAGPALVRSFERLMAVDRRRVADNHARLAELVDRHGGPDGEVRVFCSHDPGELEALRASTTASPVRNRAR